MRRVTILILIILGCLSTYAQTVPVIQAKTDSGENKYNTCANIDVHCLAKGTKIAIVDGHKNIEDLKVGDSIEAINLEGVSGSYVPKVSITKIHKVKHTHMLKLTLENEMQIIVTADHPFYTADGWASFDPEKTKVYERYKNSDIKKYDIGTEFYTDPLNPSKLKSIEEVDGKFETYSLELDCPSCWYIANGFLVGQE